MMIFTELEYLEDGSVVILRSFAKPSTSSSIHQKKKHMVKKTPVQSGETTLWE